MTARQDRSMMTSLPAVATMMGHRFGDAWDGYCARAGRLFPRRAS